MTERKTAYNTGLAKVAVQCSADTFVVNQSLVLRINICGENRHLRQAQNRCEAILPCGVKVSRNATHYSQALHSFASHREALDHN